LRTVQKISRFYLREESALAPLHRIVRMYEQKYSVPSRAISARPPRRWNSFMPPFSRSAAPFRLRRRRIAILIYVECK